MERQVESDGARIGYTIEGPADAPVLLFINSIGTTRDLWARQVAPLAGRYRAIRYDARGHGRSSAPSVDYTIAQLGHDALAILDEVGAASAHVCGISLGGLTAMWLGVHAPHRVRSLVLANTAARIGSVQSWTDRMALVREQGMAGVANLAIPRWFTPAFREREPQTVEAFRTMIESCPQDGYLGCCAAMRHEDLRDAIGAIQCPVLAVAGRADEPTPVEALQLIHDRIAGSRLVLLDAAHLSNVEQHQEFNLEIIEFLQSGRSGKVEEVEK